MRQFVRSAAAAAILAGIVGSAGAATAPTTVKVALLDMSSIAGPGMGPGARMGGGGPEMGPQGQGRGPGMTAPDGQGRMGPGHMGRGWGWGGEGGPGWMAQNMMGPGMMGMGMMSVRATQTSAKAGKVRFEVVNYSASLPHELEIVAVDNVNAPLPYDYNTAKVKVAKDRILAEAEDIAPGQQKVLEVDLKPGSYLLVCNIPGHYAAGMVRPFIVTQ